MVTTCGKEVKERTRVEVDIKEGGMSIAGDLRRSMADEWTAEANYKKRAQYADPITKKLYLHIAREEQGHFLEFKRRLANVKE